MIYKLTSSREVVAKVFSDLDLKEESQRISDIQEWISEAVEKIGASSQLRKVVSGNDDQPYLELNNYQSVMPSDLYRLNGVYYSTSINGPWIKLSKASGAIHVGISSDSKKSNRIINDQVLIDTVKSLYQKYVDDPVYTWFNKMDNETALYILNTNSNVRTILTNLINAAGKTGVSSSDYGLKYFVKPGYIVTNIRDGFLKISYDAHYIDDDGYMLIPDLASYKEAIFWYVVIKLSYPEYHAGRMSERVYSNARRSWNFYCKQAYADAMMPDQDDMENIKRSWLSLVPEINYRDRDYIDLGLGQSVYNQNK